MKIFHVFRAPVGGLFRHVVDLATLQVQAGHQVGLIADETTGGMQADMRLAELLPLMELGIHRLPMHRNPNGRDLFAQLRINRIIADVGTDIVHGHGSKGGLFARLPGIAGGKGPLRVYTPHGGSLNYHPGTATHSFYMQIERLLERGTDLLLFESKFVADRYFEYVCKSNKPSQIFFNGLLPVELMPIEHDKNAADFMFIGELRPVKGVDIIIESLANVSRALKHSVTLNIFGTGPDENMLRALVEKYKLSHAVQFLGQAPARSAFERGKVMLMGSSFESMPYVVLEAAGCAQPIISTNVGGIPEIFGVESSALIKPNCVNAMSAAMMDAIEQPDILNAQAQRLRSRISNDFSAQRMASTIENSYLHAMNCRNYTVVAA